MLSERERLILALLREQGELTRSNLIRLTGLSGTAVFRATEELVSQGLIHLGEPQAQGRGQPSHSVSLRQDAVFSAGLAVMTDLAEMLLINFSGRVVHSLTLPMDGMSRDELLHRLETFIADAARNGVVVPNRIHSLGVAVAGFFIGDGSKLNPGPELDDWALVDLENLIGQRLGMTVMVENIANAAALGEQLLGHGRNLSDFAYVSVASGFGGGLIRDGKLWRGTHGNAGEFAALLRHAGCETPNLESLRASMARHGFQTSNVRDMIVCFDIGLPGVAEWVDWAAPIFARLALLVHATVDMQALVLGGRLPGQLAGLVAERATQLLQQQDHVPRRGSGLPPPQILPAEISSDAAAIGAATIPLARDYFSPVSHLRTA